MPNTLDPPSEADGVTLRYYKGGDEVTEQVPAATVNRWVQECRSLESAGIVLLTAMHIARNRNLEGDLLNEFVAAGHAIHADIKQLPSA